MQLKSIFISTCVFSSLALTACQNNHDSKAPETNPAPVEAPAEPGYQDISKLSLEEGLRAKYSRLQLVCQNLLVSYVEDPRDPAFSKAIKSATPKVVVWDLLKDFRQTHSFDFHKVAAQTEMKVHLDLEVKLHPGTLRMDRGVRERVLIKNGVRLITQVESIVEQQDQDGRTLFVSSQEAENSRPVSISEKSSQPILKETVGNDGWKYDVNFECELEADLKPAFQSDVQVMN